MSKPRKKTEGRSEAATAGTGKRQAILAYLLKRGATDPRHGVTWGELKEKGFGPAEVGAMVEWEHLAVAEVVYVTPAGRKLVKK